ncbi:MAG: PhzF family phenazine biosynthesis protein [Clostridia bacterium]|nr:PhzF family phenazine biosynthesis protein [Clostridia bacterium]
MKQYIVDAFTDTVFRGNQAAVCVLERGSWPKDSLMQSIAAENRFSETAFVMPAGAARTYQLRWFTPEGEIDFCGHATMGTAYVLLRFYEPDAAQVWFEAQIGTLAAQRDGDRIELDFPAYPCSQTDVTEEIASAIGIVPLEAYLSRDLLLVLPDEDAVRRLSPDQARLMNLPGLLTVVTAKGTGEYDCVSRIFAPKLGIPEDPVTGSAHCMITPYWCSRLGKDTLICFQASERSGALYTRLDGDRVKISGKAVLYSVGDILTDLDV